jgi:hypothetical protein
VLRGKILFPKLTAVFFYEYCAGYHSHYTEKYSGNKQWATVVAWEDEAMNLRGLRKYKKQSSQRQ